MRLHARLPPIFPGHGCLDDLTTEGSFNLQATFIIVGLSFIMVPWVFVQPGTGCRLVNSCSNWMSALYLYSWVWCSVDLLPRRRTVDARLAPGRQQSSSWIARPREAPRQSSPDHVTPALCLWRGGNGPAYQSQCHPCKWKAILHVHILHILHFLFQFIRVS